MPTPPTPITTLYTLAATLGCARVSIDPPEGTPDTRIGCSVVVDGRFVATARGETVDGAVDACLQELRWYAKLQAAQMRRREGSEETRAWWARRAAEIEEVAA